VLTVIKGNKTNAKTGSTKKSIVDSIKHTNRITKFGKNLTIEKINAFL
jgi:hypothetical protein